jgi:hypothetical protein
MTIHVYDPIGGPKCNNILHRGLRTVCMCERKRGHDLPAHVGTDDEGNEWAWGYPEDEWA